MSQANMTLANVARTLFRANLNDALAALASCQSGTSRPTGIPAGGLWVNTTTATSWVVNLFDGTDDIAVGTVDTTTNVFTPSIAAASLTYSKIQNVSATSRILGRVSAGAGVIEEIPIGTAANNLVRLDGSARLPAVDGSLLTGISSTGRLLRAPQLLTSGTSYTTPAGCNYVHVVAVGGGGGGKSNISNSTLDGYGGVGGRVSEYALSVSPNTTYSYSVGAGGNAGSPGGSTPGIGGNSVITLAGFTITAEGSRGNRNNGYSGGNGGPIFGANAGDSSIGSGGLGYGAGGAGSTWAWQSSNGVQGIIVIWEYAI